MRKIQLQIPEIVGVNNFDGTPSRRKLSRMVARADSFLWEMLAVCARQVAAIIDGRARVLRASLAHRRNVPTAGRRSLVRRKIARHEHVGTQRVAIHWSYALTSNTAFRRPTTDLTGRCNA